ncbi:MAG: hypothetical protein QNK23_03580 [Crocinitomicaceae bacterium]|nr:hypothetical protein [Crocinitomicaceae bacterium]
MFKIVWLLSLSSLFFACSSGISTSNSENEPNSEEVLIPFEGKRIDLDSTLSIEIPEYFKPTGSLESGALVQYSSLFHGEYLIVLSDEASTSIDRIKFEKAFNQENSDFLNFAQYSYASFEEKREIIEESEWFEFTVDSINVLAKAVDIKESGDSQTLSYWLSYVEIDDVFYTLKTWTYFNRKRQFEGQVNEMIRSLRKK